MQPKSPAVKPQLLVCYLCGQQFGTASLHIHIPQCYDKKMKQWMNDDPATRGPKPKDPNKVDLSKASQMTREEFNNEQFGQFTENLAQCENCGRKFLPDRLVVHQRSCKPGASGGGSRPVRGREPDRSTTPTRPSTQSRTRDGPAVKPQLLVCYLCGQQFGTASLHIHIPQCYEKKMKQWMRDDPATRGPKPKDPSTVDLSKVSQMTKEEFNNEQFGQFTENLAQCENCGRKFLPDRLVVHQRSCKPGASGGGSRPVRGREPDRSTTPTRPSTSTSSQGRSRDGPAVKPQLLVCYLCGQQFGTASLSIHMPQCYEKKMKQWMKDDPATRGPKPKDPSTVDLSKASQMTKEEFNNEQFGQFTENLAQCENCGRKFLPDRLVVHLRSCKPGASGGGSKPVRARSPGAGGMNETVPLPPSGRPVSPTSRPKTHDVPQPQRADGGPPRTMQQPPVKKLPPRLRALQRILFDDADLNKDEKIDLSELRKMVREIEGESETVEQDVTTLMKSLDLNRDGFIDRDEWAQLKGISGESAMPLRNRLPSQGAEGGSAGGTIAPRTCTKCQTVEYDVAAVFCGDCGSKLPAAGSKSPKAAASTFPCQSCGSMLNAGMHFCNKCGSRQEEKQKKEAQGSAQPESLEIVTCPNCGFGGDAGAKFCEECGTALGSSNGNAEGRPRRATNMICEECGEIFSLDAKFCEECGQQLAPFPLGSQLVEASGDETPVEIDHTFTPTKSKGAGKNLPPNRQQPTANRQSPSRNNEKDKNVWKERREANREADYPSIPSPALKSTGKSYDDGDEEEAYMDQGEDNRVSCSICGRMFNPDVIAKHERVCPQAKKRRVFDSRKVRVEGTEMAQFARKIEREDMRPPPKKESKWKQQSQEFRKAMQAARKVDEVLKAGGTAKDLPPPTYSENAHYVPCPSCGRRFAPDVAERHIPKCRNIVNKPKAPPPRRR